MSRRIYWSDGVRRGPEAWDEFVAWFHKTYGILSRKERAALAAGQPRKRSNSYKKYDIERQRIRKGRIPAWADREALKRLYEECARLTRETGIQHNVDHVIPITGKNVCGLTVIENLRIITADANRRKSNRWQDTAA